MSEPFQFEVYMFNFKNIAFSILLLISFLLGYQYANTKCELTLKELESKSNEAVVQEMEKVAVKTKETQQLADKTGESLDVSQEKIQNDYSVLSSSNLFGSDWVYSNSTAKTNNNLSDSANITAESRKEAQCKCPKDNAGELFRIQKLYEKELEKARDCDLAITQLNSLIDYYNSLQKTLQR